MCETKNRLGKLYVKYASIIIIIIILSVKQIFYKQLK